MLLFSLNNNIWAETSLIYNFNSYKWKGSGLVDKDTSEFDHCNVIAPYTDDSNLVFGSTADNSFVLAFSDPKWKLNEGDTYPVYLYIDKNSIGKYDAEVIDKTVLMIKQDLRKYFEAFQYGNNLIIKASNQDITYPLTGSKKALQDLNKCAQLLSRAYPNQTYAQSNDTNPFLSNNNQSKNPFSNNQNYNDITDEDSDANTIRIVLKAAGLLNPELVSPSSLGVDSANFAWTSENPDIIGFYFLIVSEKRISEFASDFLLGIGGDCDGTFLSSKEKPVQLDDTLILKMGASCETTKDTYIYSGTLVQTDNEFELLINYARPKDSEKLIEVNNNIYELFSNGSDSNNSSKNTSEITF